MHLKGSVGLPMQLSWLDYLFQWSKNAAEIWLSSRDCGNAGHLSTTVVVGPTKTRIFHPSPSFEAESRLLQAGCHLQYLTQLSWARHGEQPWLYHLVGHHGFVDTRCIHVALSSIFCMEDDRR